MSQPQSQKHTPADSYKDQYEWYGFDGEDGEPDGPRGADEAGATSRPEEREKSFRKRLLSDSVKEGTNGSQQFEEEIKHKNKLLKNIQNAQRSITAFEQDLIERSERLRSQRADQSLEGFSAHQQREGQIASQQHNKQNPLLSGHLESKQNSNFYPIEQVNSNRQTTDRGTIQSASEMGTIGPGQMVQSKTQDYQIHLSRGIDSNPALISNSESLQSLGSGGSNLKAHPRQYDAKNWIARNGAKNIYNDHQPGSSAAIGDIDIRITTQSNERAYDNSRNYNRRASHTDMEILNDPGKIEAQVRAATSSQGGTDRVNIKQAILKKPYQSPNDSHFTQVQMSKQNSSTYLKMRQNSAQNVRPSDVESQARQSAPLRQPSRSPSQKSAKTQNTGQTQFSNHNNNYAGVGVAALTPQQPFLEANISQRHLMMLNSDSTKISGLHHEQSMSPTRNPNPSSALQQRPGPTIQETNAEQDLDTSHEESQVLKQPLYYMQPVKGDQLRHQQQYRRPGGMPAEQIQIKQQNLILEEDSSPTHYKESVHGQGSHLKYNTLTNGAEKFVFNSNVLNSDGGQDVQQQHQPPVGHTEPFLWSYDNQELLASQKQDNHDMKEYIVVEQEPSVRGSKAQASGHHTGGSFGNLEDFQRQMGVRHAQGSKATIDHARSKRELPEHAQTLEQDQQNVLSYQELSRQQQTHQQSRGILSNVSPMRSRKQARDSDENSTFIKIEQMIQKQDEGSKGRQEEEGDRRHDYQVRQTAARDGSQRSQPRPKAGDHSERSKVRIVCDTLGNRNDNVIYTVDSSAEFKKRKFENLKQGSQAFRSSKSRQRKEMKKDLQKRRGGSSLSNRSNERAYSPDKPFARSNQKKSRVLSTTRLSSDNDSYSQSERRLEKSRIAHSQGRIRNSLSRERVKLARKQHTTRAQTLDRPETALIRAEIYKYFLENKPSPEKRLTREKKSLSNKSMPSNNQRSRSLSKRQTKAKNHERCKSQNKERKTNKSSGTRSQRKGNASVLSGKQARGSSLPRDAKPPKRKNLNTIGSNLNTIDPKAKQLQSPINPIKRKQSASNFHKHRNSLQTPTGPSLAKSKKASQSRPATRKSEEHSTKETSADGLTSDSLAQKLLTDLAAKYRNMERVNLIQMKTQPSRGSFAGNVTAQLSQKNQMFQDIQSLAQALMKAEKKLQRQKADSKQHIQKLKAIIEDQEQCMQLMQEKIQRLVSRGNRVERHEQKARREHSKDRQKLTEELEAAGIELDKEKARRGLDKAKWEKERKDIIIGMEKELQSMQLKVQKKCDLKVNSLQGINDHLNVKIQELIKTEQDYQNVKKEYDQSIVMLNEQQERLAEMGNINEELKQQNQHLSMRQERSTIEQTEQCVHLRKQIEQMHTKYEQKVRTLKEQHHNEVQKYKISQVMNDFSKRYQFEDKISDQELLMKQLNDQNASKDAKIQELESQLQKERSGRNDKERQIGEQLKTANQRSERVKIELTDLQGKVSQLQKQIEKKEKVLEELKEKEASAQDLSDQAMADKDQKINNLQKRLDSRNDQLEQLRSDFDQKERESQDERNQKEIELQTLTAKIDLQQQEIAILAQGFQAQQQKLKTFSAQGSARQELESLRSPKMQEAQTSSNSYYQRHVMPLNSSSQQTQLLSSDDEPYGTRQLLGFGNAQQPMSSGNKQEPSFNRVLSLHPTFTDPSSMAESGPQGAEYFQESAAKLVLQQNAQDPATLNQSFHKNMSNASSLQSRHSHQASQAARRSNEPVIQDNYQEVRSIEVGEASLQMRRGGNPTFSGSQCAQILDSSPGKQEQQQIGRPNAQGVHSPQPVSSNEGRSRQRILVQEHTLTSQATTSTDLRNVAQNDQLNQKIEQKDQEIQILWSVISQIQQQQHQMQNGSQNAQLQQMMQSAMNSRQPDSATGDVARGGGGSHGHIDQQYLQRFMSSNSPSNNDYYQTSSSGPQQVMISEKNHDLHSDTMKPSPHHITSTKSPNIYVNTDSGVHSQLQSSRKPLAIPSHSTHHQRHQSNQSDQAPPISMMHTGSVQTVTSMNVLSERVSNTGSAIGQGMQLQRLGRQGLNAERRRYDTQSDNAIIERRGEENSEQREDRQEGNEGEDGQHSDVSSSSQELSQRAKDIHRRKQGHQIGAEQVHDESAYDDQVHALDGQIDSLLDSKLSLNSQSRQDLADVKKRISKLLHEPRQQSQSTSRSPKAGDSRATTGVTQRQYGK